MDIVTIENEVLRVDVVPDYGARITSLFDKRANREWMVQGAPSPDVGEDAVYGAREAVGWDECFPTVAPWDATRTAWGRRLRDHGDLWGRPWRILARSPEMVAASYADRSFRFSRTLSLGGPVLTASYEVENLSGRDLPYLWALHGLFAVTPADQIVVEGIDTLAATYVVDDNRVLPSGAMGWPDGKGAFGFALDRVQPASRGFAGKFYTVPAHPKRASVGRDGAFLTLAWQEGLSLGLWLNYGGWPEAGGSHHIALEPTSAPADHLGEAIASDTPIVLPPGGRRKWTATLRVEGSCSCE